MFGQSSFKEVSLKLFRDFLFLASLSVAMSLVLTEPAYAYLDPGTINMVVQMVIGALVGGLVTMKIYWTRIVDFLSRRSKKTAAPPDQEPTNSDSLGKR